VVAAAAATTAAGKVAMRERTMLVRYVFYCGLGWAEQMSGRDEAYSRNDGEGAEQNKMVGMFVVIVMLVVWWFNRTKAGPWIGPVFSSYLGNSASTRAASTLTSSCAHNLTDSPSLAPCADGGTQHGPR